MSEAIRLTPKDASAYNNRGSIYAETKEHLKAIADFTKAIELEPSFASAYRNRGLTFDRIGKKKEARSDFLSSLQYEPNGIDNIPDEYRQDLLQTKVSD